MLVDGIGIYLVVCWIYPSSASVVWQEIKVRE